jgi:hypothetical protein
VAEIEGMMVDVMGLLLAESVALLGAHTLGRAERGNFGYERPWTPQTHVFNNDCYESIRNVRWNRRAAPGDSTKTQWNRRGAGIALNIYMEIAYQAVNDQGRCGPITNNGGANGCSSYNNHDQFEARRRRRRRWWRRRWQWRRYGLGMGRGRGGGMARN